MPTIALIATLDTKGREADFLRRRIEDAGAQALVVDTGTREPVACVPNIPRERVAEAAGTSIGALLAADDRGQAVAAMGTGLAKVLPAMVAEGTIHAALGIGGSGGTSICAAAFRALPIGFPKLIVSTVAAGNTTPYVGALDITLMPSVVDIEGLNRISMPILANAAAAIVGMAGARPPELPTRPLIGVTMFGVTTQCVKQACAILNEAGYETVVFHAVGTGGRTFETLIEQGFFAGVLDITTTEWCDELVGGIFPAGPHRLEAAARVGLPQVVCPGALDMVNFGARETVPARFADRRFHVHNPQVTLMRTTPAENRELGRIIAEKLNAATGPASFHMPLRGVSAIDAAGQPFDDPPARNALFDALRAHLDSDRVRLVEHDAHINDPEFARAIVGQLLDNLTKS